MAVVMLAIPVTISDIFAIKIVHEHDLDLWNGSRLNADILIKRSYMTLYLMEIVMCSKLITISQLFAVKMCMTLTMTFKTGQDQM